ncbi:4-hydroxy-tetrahydrodipicolinate synthase [Spirochaeta cellobiosiphila]|uniref:4-hydroxy-tetrahydrodipicolinate synthase n=1 Tax=Spirochaeta cellobiosiphila TaxID=504483 RepID=UPI000403DC6A|nr:4-hydroxy-tetrahydrodipicolinate synthase [Spirochaeta cellobiosiphila]
MFKGTYTALVTPFDKEGAVVKDQLSRIIEEQIAQGITGIVPMGSTGESPTMSHLEHAEVIKMVIEMTKGRTQVIAGTGSNATVEAISLTKQAKEMGADASLQVSPYYNKPNQEGLYRHFMTIADSVEIPLIIYNIPGRTGRNIEVETLLRLAEHPNIVGVKEASGDINQIFEIIRQAPEDFSVISGDDGLTVPLVLMGGHGVISVTSNIAPKTMGRLVEMALQGEVENAREEHYRLTPLFKALFCEINPTPIKAAMAYMGYMEPNYRLPLAPPAPANQALLEKTLKDYGFTNKML